MKLNFIWNIIKKKKSRNIYTFAKIKSETRHDIFNIVFNIFKTNVMVIYLSNNS